MIQVKTSHDANSYSIATEYHPLITTDSQLEALAILIGFYVLFNKEYFAHIREKLQVLNGLSFKKPSYSLPLATKRFFNEYKFGGHRCNR
jgi:hypothetical protein